MIKGAWFIFIVIAVICLALSGRAMAHEDSRLVLNLSSPKQCIDLSSGDGFSFRKLYALKPTAQDIKDRILWVVTGEGRIFTIDLDGGKTVDCAVIHE